MNLLSLIIIFLALVIVGSIAFIAWELTSEESMPRSEDKPQIEKMEPERPKESNKAPGSTEQSLGESCSDETPPD